MIDPGLGQAIVLAVAALRLSELALARRNDRRLRAMGGVEHGRGHYPFFVLLHAGWLVALFLTARPAAISWLWLAVFGAAMALRLWAIASLGGRWTTRVIVLAGAPLVTTGPYRWSRHPNYLAVQVELVALAFALGAPMVGVIAGIANLPLLAWRIRVEMRALGGAARGLRSGAERPNV